MATQTISVDAALATNGTAGTVIKIKPLNFMTRQFSIRGTAPYMQLRFGQKAINTMAGRMTDPTVSRSRKNRVPRDFEDDFKQAIHFDEQGGHGIPAPAFRNAMIDACRMAEFKMTMAKMSIFVVADSLDALDGTPLVTINGTPEACSMPVRNATGVADIRVRAMWRTWTAELVLRWDADQFTAEDVANLLARAGHQVGIGEGRPFSKNSAGIGMGTFELVGASEGS